VNDFFINPNGGGPKYENFAIIAALLAGFGLYLYNKEPSSEEITYQTFINDYLRPENIEMITIAEDPQSDNFRFQAKIETRDGQRVHLVLPQIVNFLYKLDQVQRELGRNVNDFVPIKYASAQSEDNQSINYLIGGSFILLLVQLYRSKHAGRKGATKSNPAKGNSMKDMMTNNMGKSNVQIYGVDKKIKTRFKHVAGMD